MRGPASDDEDAEAPKILVIALPLARGNKDVTGINPLSIAALVVAQDERDIAYLRFSTFSELSYLGRTYWIASELCARVPPQQHHPLPRRSIRRDKDTVVRGRAALAAQPAAVAGRASNPSRTWAERSVGSVDLVAPSSSELSTVAQIEVKTVVGVAVVEVKKFGRVANECG